MTQRSTACRHYVPLALFLLLGACAAAKQSAMTADDYDSFRTALRGDAGLRREQTAACIREGSAMPQAHRELMAEVLGAPLRDALPSYCEALTNALALELVRFDDYLALKTGRADQATALRVLEAVRIVPEPRLVASEFAALRERLISDDAFREEQTRICARELDSMWSPAERASFASELGVNPGGVVGSWCERLHSAIASGHLGYQEWQALINSTPENERARAIRVLRNEPDGLS